jgi:hypothetical protein
MFNFFFPKMNFLLAKIVKHTLIQLRTNTQSGHSQTFRISNKFLISIRSYILVATGWTTEGLEFESR